MTKSIEILKYTFKLLENEYATYFYEDSFVEQSGWSDHCIQYGNEDAFLGQCHYVLYGTKRRETQYIPSYQ